jgi:putative hemolysin
MTATAILIAVSVFAVSVAMQALFAGYETGFVSANPIRIRYLAEEERLSRAARLLRYLHRPDRMLTMLLLGTNLSLVAGTLALGRIHMLQDWAVTLIATPIFLIFSEIIPKSVFRTHPSRLSLALLPVVHVFYVLLSPLTIPIAAVIRFLLRSHNGDQPHISPFMSSLEDVRILVDESADHGTIEREEQRMIHSVIDLQTTEAQEVMVPRVRIEALPDTATRRDLLELLEKTGRTRIPVYRETIDEVVGVINAYDVLLDTQPANEDILRFVEPVMHVPDTMKLDDLFKSLTRQQQHMAIVTDEYGGTDGLITLEDILEEIFGEIQDEHDKEESRIYQVSPNAYVVDARLALEEASQVLGIEVKDEEVETVGGWVMRVAGRIPAQGEVIMTEQFRLTVLEGGTNYVGKIRMEVLPQTQKVHVEKV